MVKKRSIFFLLIYCAAFLLPFATVVHFKLNQKSITEEFCINISKPLLECDGKCHLSEVLSKQVASDDESKLLKVETCELIGKINGLDWLEVKSVEPIIYEYTSIQYALNYFLTNYPPPKVFV